MNFVILDYDIEADGRLAQRLGVRAHPAYAAIQPDGERVTERRFGALDAVALRTLLDSLASVPR